MFVLEQEYGIGEDDLDGFEIVDGEDLDGELSDEDDEEFDEDDEDLDEEDLDEDEEDDDLIDLDDEYDDFEERDESGTPGRYDD